MTEQGNTLRGTRENVTQGTRSRGLIKRSIYQDVLWSSGGLRMFKDYALYRTPSLVFRE